LKQLERKYFKSCGSLPIFNFYKVLNTKELSWLVRGFEVDDEPLEFSEEEQAELQALWFDITCQYGELFGEEKNSNQYITIAQISEMTSELEIVSSLVSLYYLKPSEALKMEIEKWKYFPDDPEKTKKKLEGLKFQIEFTKGKHKELFKPEEEEVESDKAKYNLYSDVVLFENSMNITIDVHDTVVEKWVMIMLQHNEIQRIKMKSLKK